MRIQRVARTFLRHGADCEVRIPGLPVFPDAPPPKFISFFARSVSDTYGHFNGLLFLQRVLQQFDESCETQKKPLHRYPAQGFVAFHP